MNDVEQFLPARLTALADSIAAGGRVSPDDVVARHRQRRRTRAGVLSTVAAMVVIAVGVPATVGSLSSAPAGPAAPAPATVVPDRTSEAERSASAEADRAAAAEAEAERASAAEAEAERASAEEAQAGVAAAAAQAAAAAAAPELEATAAALGGPVVLRSPAEWDRWLPAGKPYPGVSTEEDMATCPRLSARLGEALDDEFSYWTGTLPAGPSGCTWVPVPLSYDGPYDYAYLVDVGFLGDGTTVEQLRSTYVMGGGQAEYPGATPCPSADVPGGGALILCPGMDERYDARWSLAVPDARGAGVWVLSATAQSSTGRSSAEALTVLTEQLRDIYG
ncbi:MULTISPECIES: hypothetical protein [unclassified Blastococcus]